MIPKEYLGDAVYVDFDGYHVVLTTEDGICVTNTIALEPAVIAALTRYFTRLSEAIDAYNKQMDIRAAAGKEK